jgi:hypothetical protein
MNLFSTDDGMLRKKELESDREWREESEVGGVTTGKETEEEREKKIRERWFKIRTDEKEDEEIDEDDVEMK